jgi:hypothetical protein
MADVEMYFDESEDANAQILCVGGYLFKNEKSKILRREWKHVLEREGLPYFHMVDCAHGNGFFKSFNKERRIAIQTDLFDLLKKHLEVGITISFDLRYAQLCPSDTFNGFDVITPYTLCSYFCVMHGRKWSLDHAYVGQIDYLFEAGAADEGQANRFMSKIFDVPELRDNYRYGSHRFLTKAEEPLLQAADILVWSWAKFKKDEHDPTKKVRKDLLSLLDVPHFTIHFDEPTLLAFLETVSRTNAQRLGRS